MAASIAFMALSYMVSAAISYTFPAEGPRLKDLTVSTSTYGNPIPEIWGTARAGGNMLWCSGLQEHKHRQKQGMSSFYLKYTYSANFAMGFCRGPAQTLRRIWANGKLIYDITGASKHVNNGKFNLTFYQGTEDQLPDPTMAAALGYDNTPAFRGLCYVVFTDFDLTDFGNQIPQIAAEICVTNEYTVPTTPLTTDGTTVVTNYQSDNLLVEPDFGYIYLLRVFHEDGSPTELLRFKRTSGQQDLSSQIQLPPGSIYDNGQVTHLLGMAGGFLYVNIGGPQLGNKIAMVDPYAMTVLDTIGSTRPFSNFVPLCYTIVPSIDNRYILTLGVWGECWRIPRNFKDPTDFTRWGHFGGVYTSKVACCDGYGDFYLAYSGDGSEQPDMIHIVGNQTNNFPLDVWLPNPGPGNSQLTAMVYDQATNSVVIFLSQGNHDYALRFSIDNLKVAWQIRLPTHFVISGYYAQRLINNEISWISNNRLWILDTANGTFINLNPDQNAYVDNNYLTYKDVDYSNPGEAGYPVPEGTGNSKHFFDGITNTLVTTGWVNDHAAIISAMSIAGAGSISLAHICESLFLRAGLKPDDYDTSLVNNVIIRGYGYAQQTDIRGLLAELQQVFLFDIVESDRKLVVVPRGSDTSVESISYKALASDSDSADRIEFWVEKRGSEADLPAAVTLKYMNIEQDYEQSSALSTRVYAPIPTMYSHQSDIVDTAISMTPNEAKNRANAMLYVNWSERTQHNTRLPLAYSYLDPTDCITVTMADGRSYFERIVQSEVGADFSVRTETRGQDSGAYTFDLIGDGGSGTGQTVDSPTPCRAFIFNTPYLRDLDIVGDGKYSIYYDAAANMLQDGFHGATLFESSDGQSYNIFQNFTADVEYGLVPAVVPTPQRGVYALDWDTKITIFPVPSWFALESITDAELFAGANLCIIGDEVLQFRDAVKNADGSWTIYNLLRGRRGTEWAVDKHEKHEYFIFLDTNTIGIGQQPFDQFGKTFYYRAVGNGASLSSAETTEFVYQPRDLMPYAPVHLAAKWLKSDIQISLVRRTRYAGNMVDGTGVVPLNEKTEAYEVDVLATDGVSVVRTLSVNYGPNPVDQPVVTYSAAQIQADFNNQPLSITITAYQIGAVGRGFGTTKTLIVSGTPSPTTRYWGVSVATSLNPQDVVALGNSDLANDFDKSVTYNCSGGKYPYYAFPAAYGTPSAVVVNGLPFSDFVLQNVSIGGANYIVLRFTNLQHGDSIPVQWK